MSVKDPKFQRRAEARPDEVLDAALTLFVEKGFVATSVAEIARAAGLSKGAVYLYFPSKRDILSGLIRRSLGPMVAHTEAFALLGALPPRAAIRAVLTTIAAFLDDPEQVRVPRLILREMGSVPEVLEIYREEVLDRAMPAMRALMARGIASGDFCPHTPEAAIMLLIGGPVLQLIMVYLVGIPHKSFEDMVPQYLDLIFDGLRPRGGTR